MLPIRSVELFAYPDALVARIKIELRDERGLEVTSAVEFAARTDPSQSAVVFPSRRAPDLVWATRVFRALAEERRASVVLVSSAEVYGASAHNPGLVSESRALTRDPNEIALAWRTLEASARDVFAASADTVLTVLRPSAVPVAGGEDYFSRLFTGEVAITLAGHDPSIQVLAPEDLAQAIARALSGTASATYNVAPSGVVPLKTAIERSEAARLPIPRELQMPLRHVLSQFGLSESLEQLDFIRYSWTVSDRKIRNELGYEPRFSSTDALSELHHGRMPATSEAAFDDFGLDKHFISLGSRTLFDFLERIYWRMEVEGLENVPKSGRGVLVGIHRGIMAWDGVMVTHLLARRLNRFPRFLVHPTGFRFPFVSDVTAKLGGVIACQENADYVLEHEELLGIFPEGIRGTFTMYRDAYRLRKFGRHDFVKMAIRHRAPIVPFVVLGSAETYPILGKIESSWVKQKTEWPFFPITPQLFPLVPAPLPSKWFVRFLTPVDVSMHAAEAAKKSSLVRSISDGIKQQMADALADLQSRRKSVFFG